MQTVAFPMSRQAAGKAVFRDVARVIRIGERKEGLQAFIDRRAQFFRGDNRPRTINEETADALNGSK